MPAKSKPKPAAAPAEAAPAAKRDPHARSITFRLPNEIHAGIQRMAQDEQRSLNQATCLLLTDALARRQARIDADAAELAELRRQARAAKKAARRAAQAAEA